MLGRSLTSLVEGSCRPRPKLVGQRPLGSVRQAQILFDRFHIVKHLNEAVDELRRGEVRRLTGKEKVAFGRTRWLLLKNSWNLTADQHERLSTLVRWNTPIVRAWYLKEAFNCSGSIASRCRPRPTGEMDAFRHPFTGGGPLKKFVRMSALIWRAFSPGTKLRLSNGAWKE